MKDAIRHILERNSDVDGLDDLRWDLKDTQTELVGISHDFRRGGQKRAADLIRDAVDVMESVDDLLSKALEIAE